MPASVQNVIEFNIDPKKRTVAVDAAYGDLHLKRGDDFNWLLHFRPGSNGEGLELGQLDYIKFVMREKGRYAGQAYAQGEIGSSAFDGTSKSYSMEVDFDGNALRAFLANLDATTIGFSEGGFDCTDAVSAGTTTTTTNVNENTTAVSVVPIPGATLLEDVEFMAEFEWSQGGKVQSSKTFSIWISRDLIANAVDTSLYVPPQPPVDWRFVSAMVNEGNVSNGVFGFFETQVPLEILGIEVAVQQVDATHGFRVQLTDLAGADLGGGVNYYGNVPANVPAVTLLFGSVLVLGSGDKVRAKIKNFSGDSAAGMVVNLLCRQYADTQPAGPSGPPGLTDALVTETTAPGTAATAVVVGQQVRFTLPRGNPGEDGEDGEDGTIIDNVVVTMLASNAAATGSIVGTQLRLGIPQTPAAGGPAVPPTVIESVYVNGAVAYSASSSVICMTTFTGRGKFAHIIVEFTNSDSLTQGDNQNKVVWYVTRSDQPGAKFALGSTAMSGGRTAEVCCTGQDPLTSDEEVIYTLHVEAVNYSSSGQNKLPGNAVAPRLTIVEPGV